MFNPSFTQLKLQHEKLGSVSSTLILQLEILINHKKKKQDTQTQPRQTKTQITNNKKFTGESDFTLCKVTRV